MVKGNKQLNALIENSQKVRAYDFSHLAGVEINLVGAELPKKLTGSKMTKRTKSSSESRACYTFAL